MKLPDFIGDAGFNGLRHRMGAERLGDLTLVADPNRLTEAELYDLTHGGIELNSLEDLRILPDGTLALKDSRILLYIRDVTIFRRGPNERERKMPRFHFAGCSTLRQMQSENRFNRYVFAAHQHGRFAVNIIEDKRVIRSSTEELSVCQNCLDQISYDGFSRSMLGDEKERRVAAFRLTEFFKKYPRALISQKPENSSESAPLNTYANEFDELSIKLRGERGWRCEKCGVVLAELTLRKYLHVHHKNGQKFDNRLENLQVLCICCHAQEPQHSHMRNLPEYKEFELSRTRLLNIDKGRLNKVAEPSPGNSPLDDFVRFALQNQFAYEDHRLRGGALWIEVPAGRPKVYEQLKAWGFKYKAGRGWWRN